MKITEIINNIISKINGKANINQTMYVGTTANAINRASGNQTLTGISIDGNATTATTLQNTRTIGGVSFDGSTSINLPGVNMPSNQDTTGNLTGSRYIGGGAEKPNNAIFGAGKLRYQMLSSPNLGTGVGSWNDVLWISSYTGSDVKGSNALIMSKDSDYVGVSRSNYDASAWSVPKRLAYADGTGASGTWGINVTGNSVTATTLQTARTINGVSFNGSENITVGVSGDNITWATSATDGKFDTSATNPLRSAARLNYNGYFYTTYLNLASSEDTTTAPSHIFVETDSDGFVRPQTLAQFKTNLFSGTTAIGDATATTKALTDDSTAVATTAFVKDLVGGSNAFAQSLAFNGYVKLPSGLIIQWGLSNSLTNNTFETTNFPIAFPNACISATSSIYLEGDYTEYTLSCISTITTSQIRVRMNTNAEPHRVFWTAIGY